MNNERSDELEAIVKGLEAERKFMHLMHELIKKYPRWIMRVMHASPKQDILGIDFIVVLLVKGKEVCVPVQVKSSALHLQKQLRERKDHWQARVLFVVINDYRLEKDLLYELFASLKHIRQSGYDYGSFFAEIEKTTIPSWMMDAYLASPGYLYPHIFEESVMLETE